jgi:V/A-type H+-transporting ATPase subunit A
VKTLLALLRRADAVLQMMQVTGEEGVTLDDYLTYQKALFLDLVYLQQDAFDPVDASAPLNRQRLCLELVHTLAGRPYAFTDKAEARAFFTRLTALFRNFNYARTDAPDYQHLLGELRDLADGKGQDPWSPPV